MNKDIFVEIYKKSIISSKYKWRVVDGTGRIISVSSTCYKTKEEAVKDVKAVGVGIIKVYYTEDYHSLIHFRDTTIGLIATDIKVNKIVQNAARDYNIKIPTKVENAINKYLKKITFKITY